VIYVGGVSVKTVSVATDTKEYSYSYTSSGNKEVQITIGGNEVFKKSINFSEAGQTITVAQ
jgi:hypothetical protein